MASSGQPKLVNAFLRQQSVHFVDKLSTGAMIFDLLSWGVTDEEETAVLQRLKRERTNRELAEELWVMLRGKSHSQKVAFLRCVHSKQPFLITSEPILALIREEGRRLHDVCVRACVCHSERRAPFPKRKDGYSNRNGI